MKLAVVTPSFNQADFVERTLQSVAAQKGVEVEHVVMDGGSKDGTVDVLRRFGVAVRWVSEPDNGQAHAVNKGIAATTAELIGWLNSDDVYYPEALSAVADFMRRSPEVDVVYGMADHIDRDDRAFEPYPTEPWEFARLKSRSIICQPAAFFRRRVVEAHGPLDESLHFCMDYEYWLRLAQRGARFAYLPRKLAGSRLYAETKTLGSRLRAHEEINDMLARRLGGVPMRWMVNYAFAAVDSAAPGQPGIARRLRAIPHLARAARRWPRLA